MAGMAKLWLIPCSGTTLPKFSTARVIRQVVGSLRQSQWQDKQTGQKRIKLYVKAWEWATIEPARAEQTRTAPEMER